MPQIPVLEGIRRALAVLGWLCLSRLQAVRQGCLCGGPGLSSQVTTQQSQIWAGPISKGGQVPWPRGLLSIPQTRPRPWWDCLANRSPL